MCDLGIATHYVPSDKHAALVQALGKAKLDGSDAPVLKVIEKHAKKAPKPDDMPGEIGAFTGETVGEIMDTLEEMETEWATKQHSILTSKSPLAMAVTHEALRRGAQLSFSEAMTQELNISMNFLKTQDFYEGIRAQLIDKDRNPKWSHGSVDEVTEEQIERLFKATANPRQGFLD